MKKTLLFVSLLVAARLPAQVIVGDRSYNGTQNFSGAIVSGISGVGSDPGFALSKSGAAILVATGAYRIGPAATRVSTGSSCSTTAGTASETAYFYLLNGSLNVASPTNTISCTVGGFSAFHMVVGTGFPLDLNTIPLATWSMTTGAWDSSGYVDYRALMSTPAPQPGPGVSIAGTTVGADTAVVPFFSEGTSLPVSCTSLNQIFYKTDTLGLYKCNGSTYAGPYGGGTNCTTGTINYTALTANATSQEISIMTSVSAKTRYTSVLLQEATQFAGTPTLTGSMGTAGVDTELLLPVTLKQGTAPQNYGFDAPRPPAVGTGTYNLVVQFVGSAALGNGTVTNFTGGAVNWEVCGFQVP